MVERSGGGHKKQQIQLLMTVNFLLFNVVPIVYTDSLFGFLL